MQYRGTIFETFGHFWGNQGSEVVATSWFIAVSQEILHRLHRDRFPDKWSPPIWRSLHVTLHRRQLQALSRLSLNVRCHVKIMVKCSITNILIYVDVAHKLINVCNESLFQKLKYVDNFHGNLSCVIRLLPPSRQ